jgi:hypothetical protein
MLGKTPLSSFKPTDKKFKAPKQEKYAQTEEIIIELPDITDVEIELLSIEGLPDDKKIIWVNNFNIKKGAGFWKDKEYSVYLSDKYFNQGLKFYYYDGKDVKGDVSAAPATDRPGYVVVKLKDGDPATGWG